MGRRPSTTPRDLESMLVDERTEPKALPLSLLEEITNGFSEDHQIGRGGSSVVYKGMLENGAIAVKRLSNSYMYEKEFVREVECMSKIKHKNIVRFLGYCADTQENMEIYKGNFVMAETQQRLLSFEYLPNGSLDRYITDSSAGLEWRTRYKIIKGICEGLNYLHQHNILHLDLKPANILLDDELVPKITDFGLSRHFEKEQRQAIVPQISGTRGYLAPEFITSGEITKKFDLFSLGTIIMEMLTGNKEYVVVGDVLESWSNRLEEKSLTNKQLKQIQVCAEIGIECMNYDPVKRPSIQHIMDRIMEAESMQEDTLEDMYTLQQDNAYSSKVIRDCSGPLEVYPLELRFLFERNKSITCLLHLKNNTDEQVAFRLNDKSQQVLILPIYGIIPPRTTHSVLVVAQRQKTLLPTTGNALILQSSSLSNDNFTKVFIGDYRKLWKHVQESENMVHEMKLEAVYTLEGETTSEETYYSVLRAGLFRRDIVDDIYKLSTWVTLNNNPRERKMAVRQGIKIISIMDNLGRLFSVDANTNEPWVAFRKSGQEKIATIMDYVTQEQTGTLEATTWGAASSPKFLAQREWLVAPSPNDDGHIHVYNYEMEKIDTLEAGHYAVTNIAVHPTKLCLLSVCWGFREIKLWNCDDGWKLSQTFDTEKLVNQVVFNPKDTNINSFAISCDDHRVELWDLDSLECSYTLTEHQDEVNCLDFFTREDQQQYLISGSNDKTAKIWDIQTMTCVHTLEGFLSPVMCVFVHPNLPFLITGTDDGIIHLWSSTDFRLKKILNMGSCGEVLSLALAYPVESRRVVIGQSRAISIVDFGQQGEWVAEGEETGGECA